MQTSFAGGLTSRILFREATVLLSTVSNARRLVVWDKSRRGRDNQDRRAFNAVTFVTTFLLKCLSNVVDTPSEDYFLPAGTPQC